MTYIVNANCIVSVANYCISHVNLSLGVCSGISATGLSESTFVGLNAGCSGSGIYNTFIGACAGRTFCTADRNTAVGNLAMPYPFSGSGNVAVGYLAGAGFSSGSQCHFADTFLGACSGGTCTNKQCSTGIGYASLYGVQSNPSLGNIAIGANAGQCLIHCHNVIIGAHLASGLTTSNNLIISQPNATSTWVYGNYQGRVGVGNESPAVALHVTGAIFATSEIIAYYSDRRLKENIIVIDCALEKVSKLNGVYYNPNQLAQEYGFKSEKREVGLLADEVEKIIEEVVTLAPFDMDEHKKSKSKQNYKTIKYERIVPVLIEAMKELTVIVNNLESEIELLGGK